MKAGLKNTLREFLDFPVEKGWKIRAYIEKLPSREDFVLTIEHESEKDSIIHSGQSNHTSFHVDILSENIKPFKEFPGVIDINQKIDCTFNFIAKDLNSSIKHKGNTITLSSYKLDGIKKDVKNALQRLELGKRTTSKSKSLSYVIADTKKERI